VIAWACFDAGSAGGCAQFCDGTLGGAIKGKCVLAHVQRAMQGVSYTLIHNTGDKEKLTKDYEEIKGFSSEYMKILKNRNKLELLIEGARHFPIEIHGHRLRAEDFLMDPSGMLMEYVSADTDCHASIFISKEDRYVFLMRDVTSRDVLVITAADPVGLLGGVRQETIPVSQGEGPRNAREKTIHASQGEDSRKVYSVPAQNHHLPTPRGWRPFKWRWPAHRPLRYR
jgi:hypothetical protein